nr:MAG TPA: hypothetical protein [Caudoviricetes sp.]
MLNGPYSYLTTLTSQSFQHSLCRIFTFDLIA